MPKLTYTAPPPSLMIELREVATDAHLLAAELANANLLPSDFPSELIQELLAELQTLPDGTAEGCRQPLESVRLRLPAIRRKFIQTEEQSRQPRADVDTPPPLTRGMVVDQRLGALVNSVTTALDEYRALASIEIDDAADTAPSAEIDANSASALAAIAETKKTERRLGNGIEEVARIAEPSSTKADNLKRQMHDARSLLRLARIELRMPGFVPRWYSKTIETIRDYPQLLHVSASAVKASVDIARPLVDAWSHFEHGFKTLILDSIERAANGLEAVAMKWEADRNDRKETQSAAETASPPPDFNLDLARTMILKLQDPPASWRPWIFNFDFSGAELESYEALAELTALRTLRLSRTKARGLAPLAKLTALRQLYLDDTPTGNIAPLAGLTAVEALRLDNTNTSDLAPLGGLTALQWLSLNGTSVVELAPLGRMATLRLLTLNGTRINDLSALANLTRLEELSLNDTRVSDLTPLTRLSSLQTLSLNDTLVSDLTPLAGLTTLRFLGLDHTRVKDLGPLSNLSALQTLTLVGSPVADLLPLKDLSGLRAVNLKNTPVTDLAPLLGIKMLDRVYVENEKRRDFLAKTLGARGTIVKVQHDPTP